MRPRKFPRNWSKSWWNLNSYEDDAVKEPFENRKNNFRNFIKGKPKGGKRK